MLVHFVRWFGLNVKIECSIEIVSGGGVCISGAASVYVGIV